jgi:superfamily II DNA or RNA helicase
MIARVHARPDEVVRELGSPLAGWRALPREVGAPRGVRVAEETVRPYAPPLRMAVSIRPYQTAAVRAWRTLQGSGTLVMPCGGGKTTTGLAIMAATPTPALILVHRGDLAEQWRTRALAQLGTDVCIVRAPLGKTQPRLACATFQQLATWPEPQRRALGDRFGLVVIDEAHHVPARTWAAVLSDLRGRQRLALTATPERHDDRTPLLYAHCGAVFHEVPLSQLEAGGYTLPPTVLRVDTGWTPKSGDVGGARVSARGRNRRILDLVDDAAADGRRVLVLVERVVHAERLAAALRRAGVRADHVVGELGPVERAMRLDSLRAGTLSAVVATSVADEGLDLPELDTVILATPTDALARIQQRIGRALRPSAGKRDPIVYDLVDRGATAREGWERRCELYAGFGWQVQQ